jgi:hypothetical protein
MQHALWHRQAELESASAEKRGEVVIPLEGGGTLTALPGQEFAVEAATGVRYGISWAQDEYGALTVRAKAFHARFHQLLCMLR